MRALFYNICTTIFTQVVVSSKVDYGTYSIIHSQKIPVMVPQLGTSYRSVAVSPVKKQLACIAECYKAKLSCVSAVYNTDHNHCQLSCNAGYYGFQNHTSHATNNYGVETTTYYETSTSFDKTTSSELQNDWNQTTANTGFTNYSNQTTAYNNNLTADSNQTSTSDGIQQDMNQTTDYHGLTSETTAPDSTSQSTSPVTTSSVTTDQTDGSLSTTSVDVNPSTGSYDTNETFATFVKTFQKKFYGENAGDVKFHLPGGLTVGRTIFVHGHTYDPKGRSTLLSLWRHDGKVAPLIVGALFQTNVTVFNTGNGTGHYNIQTVANTLTYPNIFQAHSDFYVEIKTTVNGFDVKINGVNDYHFSNHVNTSLSEIEWLKVADIYNGGDLINHIYNICIS